jgi:hypothetical protein
MAISFTCQGENTATQSVNANASSDITCFETQIWGMHTQTKSFWIVQISEKKLSNCEVIYFYILASCCYETLSHIVQYCYN